MEVGWKSVLVCVFEFPQERNIFHSTHKNSRAVRHDAGSQKCIADKRTWRTNIIIIKLVLERRTPEARNVNERPYTEII